MIPEGRQDDVIQSGIGFMRSITEAYGSDEGMKLWDSIANTLDPDVKGQIFFALLTGDYAGTIILHSFSTKSDRVSLIKAVRSVTGYGLKEAKDIVDHVEYGRKQKITIEPKHRNTAILQLRNAGFFV